MKVLHVSTSDASGGAARASHRIHRALVDAGLDSWMHVLDRHTDDERVSAAARRPFMRRVIQRVRQEWSNQVKTGWSTDNSVLHSFGDTGAGLVRALNDSDADILHLHWIAGMLSVQDIGRLKKPLVWTLHDMWAFCGGEHYAPDAPGARFRTGYRAENRPAGEAGPDLNRRAWESKRKAWTGKQFTIVCPSRWLADCALQSPLLGRLPTHTVPYPLDMSGVWRPVPQHAARLALSLPPDRKLILFGADGGVADPRKGADLLHAALQKKKLAANGVELVIYGQSKFGTTVKWPCPVHFLGVVRDDRLLALAYSAADVMVVPSRQDNLPNTAIEAQACGTPVVAFNLGGLPDIIVSGETGWLARPFDIDDLATGIDMCINDGDQKANMIANSRRRAQLLFSGSSVADAYKKVYELARRQ